MLFCLCWPPQSASHPHRLIDRPLHPVKGKHSRFIFVPCSCYPTSDSFWINYLYFHRLSYNLFPAAGVRDGHVVLWLAAVSTMKSQSGACFSAGSTILKGQTEGEPRRGRIESWLTLGPLSQWFSTWGPWTTKGSMNHQKSPQKDFRGPETRTWIISI